MHIVSWNINGIRSLKDKLSDLFIQLDADILCLQETKITRDMLEESLAFVDGYVSFYSFSRKRCGYSGVATYCKLSVLPTNAQDGLSGVYGEKLEYLNNIDSFWSDNDLKELDSEGRCVITLHQLKVPEKLDPVNFAVINVYCPRADPERAEREEFQLKFYKLLKEKASCLSSQGYNVLILGDLNVTHKRIDHCDPDSSEDFEKKPSRVFFDNFLKNPKDLSSSDFYMVDTFRFFHPKKTEAFTCWNTKTNARSTNYGTRIDYILSTADFLDYIDDSVIMSDFYGSDHCPVGLKVIGSGSPSEHIPLLCTKYFLEFQGQQKKLVAYFRAEKQPSNISHLTSVNSECSRKRQNSVVFPNNRKPKQTKLNNFFKKSHSCKETSLTEPYSSDKVYLPMSNIDEKEEPVVRETDSSKKLNCNWAFMMKGPKPPPLCSGHKESCILKSVKKKGINFNRKFYACSRGAGKEGDKNAQCNFFKWA